MAHRRSHAVIDSDLLLAVNEVESPSLPPFSSTSQKKRLPSAFKAGKRSHLTISIPPDNFPSGYDIADTKDGEPVVPRPCAPMAEETLALMRHMSITPRSNSGGSNSSMSFTPIKPKTPEQSIPLFLVSSWETPAILKNEYQIVGILGKGTYSVVYDAIQVSTKKRVAIKAVNKAQSEDKRLLLEISVLKRMKHPNIVQLFDVKETHDTVYLITEKVGGGELFVRISEHGAFSESCAKDILRNILHGVAYLHSQGIVHRDLKPENILLPESKDIKNIKIVDFGVATLMHASSRQFSPVSPLPYSPPTPPSPVASPGSSRAADNLRSRSRCFSQVGSLQYMAPEVINSKGHTKSVDLWSVGVVLHILLVGYPPFQIDSCNDLKMKAIAWQYGLDLFSYEGWESISVQAKHLVTQLLALDPAKRITAAAALKHPWLSGSDDVKPVPFGATHSRHIKRFAANMQRETARARSLWTREAFFSLDNSLVVKDPVEFTSPVHVPGAFKQPDSAEVTPEKSDMESSETKADDHFDGPKTASAQKRRLADDTPWRPRVVRPYVDSPSSPLKFSPASSRRGTQPAPSSSPSSRQMSGKKHNRSAEQLPAPHKLSRTGSSPKTVRACTKLPRQCIDFETNPFPPF